MSTYFDTSAVVKLLLAEDDSPHAVEALQEATAASMSRLGYVEVRAALARARGARLSPAEAVRARAGLEHIWDAMVSVEVGRPVLDAAADLADRHRLRGADAVHLASALSVDAHPIRFACFDADLRAAATAEGLEVVPA